MPYLKLKKSYILSFTLCILCFSSCVMYYHTNEVRDNFKKSINQISTLSGKVHSDYKSKSALYNELLSNIINQNLEPFKSKVNLEIHHVNVVPCNTSVLLYWWCPFLQEWLNQPCLKPFSNLQASLFS